MCFSLEMSVHSLKCSRLSSHRTADLKLTVFKVWAHWNHILYSICIDTDAFNTQKSQVSSKNTLSEAQFKNLSCHVRYNRQLGSAHVLNVNGAKSLQLC